MARQEFGILRTRSLSGVVHDFGLKTENPETQTISSIQETKKMIDDALKQQIETAAPIEQGENIPLQEAEPQNKRKTHKILKVLKCIQKIAVSYLALVGIVAITYFLDQYMISAGVDPDIRAKIGLSIPVIAMVPGLRPLIKVVNKAAASETTAPQQEEKRSDKEALRMGWFR